MLLWCYLSIHFSILSIHQGSVRFDFSFLSIRQKMRDVSLMPCDVRFDDIWYWGSMSHLSMQQLHGPPMQCFSRTWRTHTHTHDCGTCKSSNCCFAARNIFQQTQVGPKCLMVGGTRSPWIKLCTYFRVIGANMTKSWWYTTYLWYANHQP